MSSKQKLYAFLFQIIVVYFCSIDDIDYSENEEYWKNFMISIAKYIYCSLLIKGARGAFNFIYSGNNFGDILSVFDGNIMNAIMFSIASSILAQTDNLLVGRQLTQQFIVHLLIENKKCDSNISDDIKAKNKKEDVKEVVAQAKPSINYGTGMACSYFEGYLIQVLPNDGGALQGIENNIRNAEARMGVIFPVKRLFIIITKSMYCPPELTAFNMEDKTRPFLERCLPLADIQRNVAGVIDRLYRNSVYKIRREGARTLYVVAECASPLNTLYKVLQKRVLYQTLSDIDVDAVVKDFCDTLHTIVNRSNECRNKCELLYIDDTNPNENLAEILINRIREIAPNFEQIIEQTD